MLPFCFVRIGCVTGFSSQPVRHLWIPEQQAADRTKRTSKRVPNGKRAAHTTGRITKRTKRQNARITGSISNCTAQNATPSDACAIATIQNHSNGQPGSGRSRTGRDGGQCSRRGICEIGNGFLPSTGHTIRRIRKMRNLRGKAYYAAHQTAVRARQRRSSQRRKAAK